jgi:hypothetical protein
MAREHATKTLETTPDAVSVTVQQLGAMQSLRLLHKLTRALAPALAKMVGKGKGSLADLDLDNVAVAADLFFTHFSEQDLEDVTRQLLGEGTLLTHKGQTGPASVMFGTVFDGRPDLLLKAILFALEVNYRNFFNAARELMATRGAGASPLTSIPTLKKSGPASG